MTVHAGTTFVVTIATNPATKKTNARTNTKISGLTTSATKTKTVIPTSAAVVRKLTKGKMLTKREKRSYSNQKL